MKKINLEKHLREYQILYINNLKDCITFYKIKNSTRNKQIINMCNERIEALGVILNKTDLKEIELNNL